MKKIFIAEPIGGLCNRMNVIRFAYHFCEKHDYKLIVIWNNNNNELACNYQDIFLNSNYKVISLKWPKDTWKNLLKRKRWYELIYSFLFWCIYKVTHKILISKDCHIQPSEKTDVRKFVEESERKFLEKGRIIYYHQHYNPDLLYDYSMLLFKRELIDKAEKLLSNSKKRIIGVHIRRTDHKICIDRTPEAIFLEKMRWEINETPETIFYIATDDAEELDKMKELFGDRLLYNPNCVRKRSDKEGIYDAAIDLIALSKTEKIIGSNGSTFSYVAAFLGNCPLEFYYSETKDWRVFSIG